MPKPDTVTRVYPYEINGEEVATERPALVIRNHWNYGDRVVLDLREFIDAGFHEKGPLSAGCSTITLIGRHLEVAVDSAMRARSMV